MPIMQENIFQETFFSASFEIKSCATFAAGREFDNLIIREFDNWGISGWGKWGLNIVLLFQNIQIPI